MKPFRIHGGHGKGDGRRYYKQIVSGYIPAIGTGNGGVEVTEAEYAEIPALIADNVRSPERFPSGWEKE